MMVPELPKGIAVGKTWEIGPAPSLLPPGFGGLSGQSPWDLLGFLCLNQIKVPILRGAVQTGLCSPELRALSQVAELCTQ